MTTTGWRIGSLAGAPILLAPSFVLLAVLIGAVNVPSQIELGAFGQSAWALPVGYVLILFCSVLCHELAHGVTGLATGHRPSEIVVNVWGGHTAFGRVETKPARSALIAGVGPVSNLALAGVGWVLLLTTPPDISIGQQLLVAFTFMNVLLGIFNLLPGFPLDGGQILASVVWAATGSRAKGYLVAGWAGRAIAVVAVALALGWFLSSGRLGVLSLIWSAFIGFSLWQAASSVLQSAAVQSRAEKVDLRRLVRPAVVVPSGSTIDDLVQRLGASAERDPHFAVVVASNGPVGVVDPSQVARVPAEQRAGLSVDQVAQPHSPADVVDVAQSGEGLLNRLGDITSEQLVVLDDGQIVGVIPGAVLMAALTR